MKLLPFEERLAGRRVLVTGDTGFTGSWLVSWLKKIGASTVGLALPPPSLSLFKEADLANSIFHTDCDIRDAAAVKTFLADTRPEFVFHLAAQPLVRQSYVDPVETYATNVMGTVNVLDACRSLPNLKGIVVITTDKVYRNNEWLWGYRETDALGGKDPYSASKAACELVVASYRDSFFAKSDPTIPIAVARAGNIVGGGDWAEDRIVPDIVRAIAANEPMKIRNPESTRPWQHVLSACHGYLLVAAGLVDRPDVVADAWNFGPEFSDTRRVADIVDAFRANWTAPDIEHVPSAISEARALMIDSQRARQILGWQPAWQFDDLMLRTSRWYESYYNKRLTAADLCSEDLEAYRSVLLSRLSQ